MLSGERGRCSMQGNMNQVGLSQINTGGDKIYGQLTRQQVEGKALVTQRLWQGVKMSLDLTQRVGEAIIGLFKWPGPNEEMFPAAAEAAAGTGRAAVSAAGAQLLFGECTASVFFTALGSRRETLRMFIAALMDGGVRSFCTPELIFCILRSSKCLFRL